jgi:hypothetical protein
MNCLPTMECLARSIAKDGVRLASHEQCLYDMRSGDQVKSAEHDVLDILKSTVCKTHQKDC